MATLGQQGAFKLQLLACVSLRCQEEDGLGFRVPIGSLVVPFWDFLLEF